MHAQTRSIILASYHIVSFCRRPGAHIAEALHDGARNAAATAVVGADARALARLRLDDGAGGRRDGAGGRHLVVELLETGLA
jgi:hypothetical protein